MCVHCTLYLLQERFGSVPGMRRFGSVGSAPVGTGRGGAPGPYQRVWRAGSQGSWPDDTRPEPIHQYSNQSIN